MQNGFPIPDATGWKSKPKKKPKPTRAPEPWSKQIVTKESK